jgi:hypothetical protein
MKFMFAQRHGVTEKTEIGLLNLEIEVGFLCVSVPQW